MHLVRSVTLCTLAALGLALAAAPGRATSAAACGSSIAAFKRAVDSDARTGNMHRSVHNRVKPEIDRAEAACAAGRDAEALRMINATKGRYGYN